MGRAGRSSARDATNTAGMPGAFQLIMGLSPIEKWMVSTGKSDLNEFKWMIWE